MGWNPLKKSSWKKAGNAIVDTTKKVGDVIVDTTNKVVDVIVDTTNDTVKKSSDVVNDTAKILNKTTAEVNKEIDNTISEINKTVLKPAEKATMDSLKEAAKVSNIATTEFVAGMNIAGDALQTAGEETLEGLVAAGKYLEQYACNIAIGGALTGAFAATLNNPGSQAQNTTMFAPLSMATATSMVSNAVAEVAVRAACSTCSAFMVDIIWTIPDVRNTVGSKNKDTLSSTIATLIQFTVVKSPYALLSPQTASITVAGIVSFVVASLVCDGKLPIV
jgi:hypothetical protein